MTRSVAIVVFDDVEALDFAGPFEVFTTATRVALKRGLDAPFSVRSVATRAEITVRAGITVRVDDVIEHTPAEASPDGSAGAGLVRSDQATADQASADQASAGLVDRSLVERPDILIVPGGVTTAAEADAALLSWIRHTSLTSELTASICTGAFLLAAAGLLEGRTATTHWEDIDELEKRFGAVTCVRDVRWVDDGDIVSSAGISAGIDMSLHLVARLVSDELAVATARQMDYHWQ